MRQEKSGVRYFGFEELAKAYGITPTKKRTKDEKKLKKQRENFVNRHICRGCKMPMSYVGANIMACTNPDCKGIKVEKTAQDGTVSTSYVPSFDLLDDKGADIAYNIFD